MHSKKINKTFKALKYLFLPIYCIVFGEIFLSVFYPRPMLPRYVEAGSLGIRQNMPDSTYFHKTPDYRVKITTNNRGIRSDYDISYDKPEGIKRIVLLGDSFGMGYGVNLEDTFLYKLQQKLESDGYSIEVVNLSVSGYGTAEELVMFEGEAIKYHPDLVILCWHRTDYDDNIRSALFQYYGQNLSRLNKEYLPAVKVREALFSIPFYRWLAGNSHFYNWLREVAGTQSKIMLTKIKRIMAFQLIESGERRENQVEEILTDDKKSSHSDYPTELSIALINEINKKCNDVESSFILLDIPQRTGRASFSSTCPLTMHDVDFPIVNPIEAFRKHKGELLYWERSHGHFTPLGTSIVAEELYLTVIENNLLKTSNK